MRKTQDKKAKAPGAGAFKSLKISLPENSIVTVAMVLEIDRILFYSHPQQMLAAYLALSNEFLSSNKPPKYLTVANNDDLHFLSQLLLKIWETQEKCK
jgi:hypothetical protein